MLDGTWRFGTPKQESLKWKQTIDIAKKMIEFNKQRSVRFRELEELAH